MSRRRTLSLIVRGMLLALVLAFFAVLFASLNTRHTSGSGSAEPDAIGLAIFNDIPLGQSEMRRFDGQRVWVTHLSAALKAQLATLNEVVQTASTGCQANTEYCVLVAASSRDGLDMVFSATSPAQLAPDLPWYGGFVDPANGRVYDRLGRAYHSKLETSAMRAIELP